MGGPMDAVATDSGVGAPPALLVLHDIVMEYGLPGGGALRVVDGMTLSVRSGEVVCLAGRSGSGKTTVLMICAGLLRPTAGGVRWGGVDLSELTGDALTAERGRHIGIVFQNGALIGSLRASENVAIPGMAGGDGPDPAARAAALLHVVGLPDRGSHFPGMLSGGEQQRVAIARSLFRDPPLLLVDEPTANLDRHAAADVVDLLVRLRDSGRGLLVASHDERVIAAAGRVIEMEPDR